MTFSSLGGWLKIRVDFILACVFVFSQYFFHFRSGKWKKCGILSVKVCKKCEVLSLKGLYEPCRNHHDDDDDDDDDEKGECHFAWSASLLVYTMYHSYRCAGSVCCIYCTIFSLESLYPTLGTSPNICHDNSLTRVFVSVVMNLHWQKL